jgi:hypothetical protein
MELTCLVFIDTMQSLFRRRLPILQYRVGIPYAVDRYAGFCCSLLPLLYRLCVMATAMREDKDVVLPASIWNELADDILSWSICIFPQPLDGFDEDEMLLLAAQARVQRETALLILHRLRTPLTMRRDDLELRSQCIVNELEHCLAKAGRAPPNVTLSLVMAAAEARDTMSRGKILSLVTALHGYHIYPAFKGLRALVEQIWVSQVNGPAQCLFTVFDRHVELNILP